MELSKPFTFGHVAVFLGGFADHSYCHAGAFGAAGPQRRADANGVEKSIRVHLDVDWRVRH